VQQCGRIGHARLVPAVGRHQQGARQPCGTSEQLLSFGVVAMDERRLEQLAHDPVPQAALELVADRAQDPPPALACGLGPGRQQCALADAGRAVDDQQPPGSAGGRLRRVAEAVELPIALDQIRRRGHHLSTPQNRRPRARGAIAGI
jgi:hypothetical protein